MRDSVAEPFAGLQEAAWNADLGWIQAGVGFVEGFWRALRIDRYDLHARTLPVYVAIAPVILGLVSVLPQGLGLPLAGGHCVGIDSDVLRRRAIGCGFGQAGGKWIVAKVERASDHAVPEAWQR